MDPKHRVKKGLHYTAYFVKCFYVGMIGKSPKYMYIVCLSFRVVGKFG